MVGKIQIRGLKENDFQQMEQCVKKMKIEMGKIWGKPVNEEDITDTLFGDVAVTLEQCQFLLTNEQVKTRQKRKAFPYYKWDVLTIHYHIQSYFSPSQVKLIKDAFGVWQNKTCLKFQEVDASYTGKRLEIISHYGGCWSYIGMVPHYYNMPRQPISLYPEWCLQSVGRAIHEIGHALGFMHEVSRNDRDNYVVINSENIMSGYERSFYKEPYTVTYNVPYDYASIMHYQRYDFSKNGRSTLEPVNPIYRYTVGQTVDASFLDAKMMNKQYKCLDSCTNTDLKCTNGGYPDPGKFSKCKTCRCPSGLGGDCSEVVKSSSGCSPQAGFIKVVSSQESCLMSPNFPNGYQPGDSCTWLLEPPTGMNISFRFNTTAGFGIYHDSKFAGSCAYHWVEIKFNGNLMETGPRYCGNSSRILNQNETIVSKSGKVLIDFRSNYVLDENDVKLLKGFMLCYKLTMATPYGNDVTTTGNDVTSHGIDVTSHGIDVTSHGIDVTADKMHVSTYANDVRTQVVSNNTTEMPKP